MKPRSLILLLLFAMGCPAPFSRPVPSPSEYKQRFLSNLDPKQIQNLQFTYHGAIGGEASIARFRTDSAGIESIRENAQSEKAYDPNNEAAREELRRQFAMCAGSHSIPAWFDFPFGKSLLLFVDSGDFSDEHPAYSHEWYVDKDNGIVYSMVFEG